MVDGDFLQLSIEDCAEFSRFYANLLDVELDSSRPRVCNELQGVLVS